MIFGRRACVKKNGPNALTAKHLLMVAEFKVARSSIAKGGMMPGKMLHQLSIGTRYAVSGLTGNVEQYVYLLVTKTLLETLN
jgi:hypothetical protein